MKKVALILSLFLLSGTVALAQDMAARAQIINDYIAAWSEPDEDKRMDLLESSFAENGEYSDPVSITNSRQALSDLIGQYQSGETKGIVFKLLDAPQYHNGIYGRFDWIMLAPTGDVALVGMDFVTFDESGKVKQITGFFDPSKL